MSAAGLRIPPAKASRGRIYILRHGAIRFSDREKRYIGQQELPLNEEGLRQGRAWADHFAHIPPQALYCSDLERCLETARMIGRRCALDPQPLQELREVALGTWEGETLATIKARDPDAFKARGDRIADHRPPGGESFRDLDRRVRPFFETLRRRQPPEETLLVTHAGVIRILLCRLLGMPLENRFALGLSYGALSIVDVDAKGFRLQALNLPAPA